ncbi:MAG: thiamine monophosphate synthase [Alphaproteobacteria bacterium]|nr:MAG: thiamine monophosphate synthase [Alphaproteobacteria bacterium]
MTLFKRNRKPLLGPDGQALAAFAATLRPAFVRGQALPRLLYLTDRRRIPDVVAAAERLPRGSGVILRDYGYAKRAALATALHAVCRKRELVFLVGGDPRLARQVNADGVHFPEAMVDRLKLFRREAPSLILTAAAHDAKALDRAADAGADAALLSPVFPTASHPGAPALGLSAFRELVDQSPLPVYGLGGLTVDTVAQLEGLPLAGVAAIGAFADAS